MNWKYGIKEKIVIKCQMVEDSNCENKDIWLLSNAFWCFHSLRKRIL